MTIIKNNLIEIPINGRKFTRISDDGSKFSKLDCFLVKDKFISLWKDLSVDALERRESDHCPLILRDKIVDFGPKPFKVFDEWFSKEGVDRIVEEALKNVKNDLKVWSKNEFGGLDNEITKLKNKASRFELLAKNGSPSEGDRLSWLEARKCWIEKEKIKSGMLKQKARIRWILEGDENSRYFHSSIRRRYNKCNIRGLNINGEWNETPSVIKDTVFTHFQNIFGHKNCNRPSIVSWADWPGPGINRLTKAESVGLESKNSMKRRSGKLFLDVGAQKLLGRMGSIWVFSRNFGA
ncbi:uncharacterized protein [Rutidosis leptorrhynchoides]|uniref:uncharacterized protein n=1 Tax=Rutidosis leptorrhynchoides TaxID=125765 RepID=UPI003A9932BA